MTEAQIAGWLLRIVNQIQLKKHQEAGKYKIELAGLKERQAELERQKNEDPWDMGGFDRGYQKNIEFTQKDLDRAEKEASQADQLVNFTFDNVVGNRYNWEPNSGVAVKYPPNF